jgi:RNA polymerase sigma-70 factor, ECF subfamily
LSKEAAMNHPTSLPLDQDVMAIQRGDKEAFVQLFNNNRDRLLALAYRLTSSSTEAEDVVQDAFVSSWRHHDQFNGDARPSTWLYRVTFNAALMHLRSRRRKGADSLDALPQTTAEVRVQEAYERNGNDLPVPEAGIERRHLRTLLDGAFEELRPIDRTIVHLRFVEDLSTEEVSEKTGLSASAVKTRLHRARAVLREHLDTLA